MSKLKKLPDTEFEIMKAIWENKPPLTTSMLMEALGNEKGWKVPTLISFLNRLVEKGFLRTEKNGKERTYYPLIKKDDYLKFESKNFIKNYHDNSFLSLVNTLYDGKKLSSDEIRELEILIKKRSN